ncbi:hypothetical protein PAHAL_6G189200 [Panicum hallii]|uniref:Uncharacterized protein n=1 Tax=Panicum hallii TaxID=206008 RepID=A0A2S3I2B1_9POAL|nr:hypothetical protein PAHAL_6G189200 [Panicum hallii]
MGVDGLSSGPMLLQCIFADVAVSCANCCNVHFFLHVATSDIFFELVFFFMLHKVFLDVSLSDLQGACFLEKKKRL